MTDKTAQRFLSTVPFSGFCESIHSGEVDRALEMMLTDRDSGTEPAPDFIQEKAWQAIDYSGVYQSYARTYAASFLDWLSLAGEFESMTSPRFYNFETDRIFVNLTRDDLARLWRGVDKGEFSKACRDRFTSRDGFISHYSADWKTWGRLSDWDHNQIGTLLGVYAETEQGGDWDQWAEYSLMEDCAENGDIENWIWENSEKDLARAVNAWDYLQERAKRAIKTLAQWHEARRAENRPFDATPLGAFSART